MFSVSSRAEDGLLRIGHLGVHCDSSSRCGGRELCERGFERDGEHLDRHVQAGCGRDEREEARGDRHDECGSWKSRGAPAES